MRMPIIALLGLAFLVLALALAITPYTTTTANEGSIVSRIDILGLTRKAGTLPEQHFPTH
jgi:hypothetical protein